MEKMWRMRFGLFSLMILLTAGMATPKAEASMFGFKFKGGPVFDAAKFVENSKALEKYFEKLELMQKELKHLEKMNHSTVQVTKAYVVSVFNRLIMVRNTVRGITYSYALLQKEWDDTYKDFAIFHGMKASEYAKHLMVLDDKTSNALLDALKAQGFIVDIDGDHFVLKGLMDQSLDAQGILGALQVANYMAALQTAQMTRMEVVMTMSFRAQTLYYRWKIEEKMSKRAYAERNALNCDNPMNQSSAGGAFPSF